MKKYKIPITWSSLKTYEVDAENLQDAVNKAVKIFFDEPDQLYLTDSWEVAAGIEDDYPDEEYDLSKID